MATSPTAQPVLTDLPSAPNSITETKAEFNVSAVEYVAAQVAYVPEQNALADWQNDTAQEVYDNAVEAESSATSASSSAASAASSANFIGDWQDLTGSASIGDGVYHDGSFWRALSAIADITTEEPSPSNSVWVFSSGTRWVSISSSATVSANASYIITATSATSEITQPAWSENDFIVIKNSVDSTQTVRLLNPSNTIKGNIGAVAAGDDLIIPAGDTLHLIAKSSNTLEIA